MPLGRPKSSASAVPLPQGELDHGLRTTGQRHHSHWEVAALGGELGRHDEPGLRRQQSKPSRLTVRGPLHFVVYRVHLIVLGMVPLSRLGHALQCEC